MIVLDASAVVAMLMGDGPAEAIRRGIEESGDAVLAPHLVDVEVTNALRGLAAGGRLDAHRAGQFLKELAELPAKRYSHLSLLERMWELRHNFTPYDAAYIALAEATGSVLYTCDAKLARGHRAKVVLFAA